MATVAKLLTKNQADDGVKYLLSYLVTWGQYVSAISSMFGVDTGKTLQANGLSEQNFNIYPFMTLLVPLQNSPSTSQIVKLPPPLSQQSPPTSIAHPLNSSSRKTWVYALIGTLGGFALIAVFGLLIFWFRFAKRKKKEKDSFIASESFESIEKPLEKRKKLEEEDMSQNFPSSLIGGSVYRGTIKRDYVAIKKMNGDVSEEINLLNKISNLNLFRLSGGKQKKKCLDWKQRLQIGLDVAMGFNYFHSYISPPHMYKNLKSSNVLLDVDFKVKISNFGLARSADGQGGQFALTRHIIGTKGYMAPEYLENGLVSTMLDVYSFGVLLLEIFTGKEVAILYEAVNVNLAKILSPVLDEKDGIENLSQIMDSSLGGNYPSELAILLIRLIASFLKKDPLPSQPMHEIVQTLSTSVTATTSWHSKQSA
nr:lysM domain receptor-like kinase 4 [Coffea arabica]